MVACISSPGLNARANRENPGQSGLYEVVTVLLEAAANGVRLGCLFEAGSGLQCDGMLKIAVKP
jgi:hypothetical protein